MSQLEPECGPAPFCHTPMWELSASSLRQVREGAGSLQYFLSFVLRSSERAFGDKKVSVLLLSSASAWFFEVGKGKVHKNCLPWLDSGDFHKEEESNSDR